MFGPAQCMVKWAKGSTARDGVWAANFQDLQLSEEYQTEINEAAPVAKPIPAEIQVLVSHLERGSDKAKPRDALVREMNTQDRAIRELIAYARKHGIPIINIGKGYYIPDTDDEKEQYVRQEYNRAMSILTNIAPMRRELRGKGRVI